jgi:ABC-2 type transport system permease protein
MSKVHAALVITTPPMLIGTLIMLINFKINIIESILILLLTILMPLVSHFIGIIINLKFPKLNFDNSAEVVKQSVSSFLAVMIGMILLIANGYVVFGGFDEYNPTIFLGIATIVYTVINIVLYLVLSTMSVKDFRKLSI